MTTFSAPFGNPASSAHSREAQGRQRRVLGRLQDDAAAGGQRRADLPHRHHQREVPRDDRADDADRLAAGVAEELVLAEGRHRQLDRRALDLGRPAGAVAQEVHRRRHVHALRDDERLAVVQRLDLGELLRVRLQQIGQLEQPPLAVHRTRSAPLRRLERRARRPHGGIHVVGAGGRHRGEHLARGRVADVHPRAGPRVAPLAANQHLAGRAEKRPGCVADRGGNGGCAHRSIVAQIVRPPTSHLFL